MLIETSKNNNVIPPPARIKSVTRYRAGPIISALTWCVGIRKELDVEIATVIAKIAGSPPAANAIETASGTKSTVAPTFDSVTFLGDRRWQHSRRHKVA